MSLNEYRFIFRHSSRECHYWTESLKDLGYNIPDDIPDLIKRISDPKTKILLNAFMMECYGDSRKSRKNSKRKSRKNSKRKSRKNSKRKSRKYSERKSRKYSERKSRKNSKRKSRKSSERKSRKNSKRKSRKSSRVDNRQCEPQTDKKYLNRNSPPYPANKCCGLIRTGNDGYLYVSEEAKNGVCRWVRR